MENFKKQQKKLMKELRKETDFCKYWSRIHQIFEKHKNDNHNMFTLEFPHDIFDNIGIGKDDETRIEYIANRYGYKIAEERLFSSRSMYKFEAVNSEE